MNNQLNIPVGISDFKKIRENDYYYIDKSGLIKELLKRESAEVTLITRPRRFGKTMGMSMLAHFFDIRFDNRKLFKNLEVIKDEALCNAWMNQYPVVFLTLKDIDGLTFEDAYERLAVQISNLYKEHAYLLESECMDPDDKTLFKELKSGSAGKIQVGQSLHTLIRLMRDYYQKPVILLLDEYDVPMAKASSNGYYDQMLDIMKEIMSTALKDNTALRFAVITGCLKIAKESIFTGTNNFVSDNITDSRFNEYFGFTQEEDRKVSVREGMAALTIPNAEVQEIFETTIIKWFDDSAKIWNRSALFDAVWTGNSEKVTQEMNVLLRKTISYHDYKEDFYHAFLAGIFTGAGYSVESNREHGEGRSDIVVYDTMNGRAAVFEAKVSRSVDRMEADCDTALEQITDRMYMKELEEDYDQIFGYGIAFFKKRCLLKKIEQK